MRATRVLGLAIALCACAREPRVAVEPVIFGADDRIEVFEVTSDALRDAVARAVPAFVHRTRISIDVDTGAVTLRGPALGPSHDLCDGEAHFDQPSVASCSATLIDDDLVLTAGHCVESVACADQRYVFGWYYESPGVLAAIDESAVFSCADVVAFEHSGTNDFAIVQLDRAAPGPPLEVRLESVVVGETTSLAGYPLGIPMKVVEAGPVTRILSASRFYARLDAHPGNSGSGVFDASLRVVGELTNGPVEALVADGDCQRLRVIGEDTTRTETINSVIPAVAQLCGSGFPSERLCGVACGDGVCQAGEACAEDCAHDAGPLPLDAGAGDAGPAPDAGPGDAAVPLDPRVARGGGCACRVGSGPTARPAAFVLPAALAVVFCARRVVRRSLRSSRA